jgi:multidrug efflux pump subunit AcrA (membrane-fusion protein)
MFEQMNSEARVPASTGRWAAVAAIFVVMVACAFGWSMHERTTARQAGLERDQVTAQLHETESQISAISDKLNALTSAEQARQQAERDAAIKRVAQQQRMYSHSVSARRRAALESDKRWKDVESKFDEQNQKLDAAGQRIDAAHQAISKTQQDLEAAKGELSGSIARTHGELIVLQRKGERNYYEFDLNKSKQFQRTGPVSVELRKADTKHMYADLELMVEDARLQQKHVNVYQPIMFYPPDSATPMELVINQVTKNHIHGYVSAPKYRQSELKAAADGTAGSDAVPTAAPRKRLANPE